MEDHQVIRRRGTLFESELDGEIVGLDMDQGACFGLNATASWVWQLLEQPTSFGTLRRALAEEFDVDPETCREQLSALVLDLREQRLIELEAPQA